MFFFLFRLIAVNQFFHSSPLHVSVCIVAPNMSIMVIEQHNVNLKVQKNKKDFSEKSKERLIWNNQM